MMRHRGTLGPLSEESFRFLWVGQAASAVGDAVVLAALPFAVLELTGSPADVGFVLTAYALPLVAFALIGGIWSDRLRRQFVMVASDAARASVQALVALLLLTGAAQLWQLIVLTGLYSAAGAFFQPAATGLVPQTVSATRLQRANALLNTTREAVFAPTLALSGLLVAATSPGVAYAADAATFVVSALFLSRIRVKNEPRPHRQPFLADLAAGWRAAASRVWVWVTMLWSAAFLFAVVAPIQVLGPVVARDSLGGAAAWGAIAGSFSAGALAGGILAFRWHPTRPLRAAATVNFAWAAGPSLLAFAAPIVLIVPAHFAGGVASGFFTAVWATTLQERIEPEVISRVASFNSLAASGGTALGYAVAGVIAATVGTATTLLLSSAWVLVSTSGALLVPSIRGLRRAERGPREGAASARGVP